MVIEWDKTWEIHGENPGWIWDKITDVNVSVIQDGPKRLKMATQ
jgi:hypothetical protein